MQMRVLKPAYVPVPTNGDDKLWRVNWKCVGMAESIEDAKAQGHVCPILEVPGRLQLEEPRA